MYQKHRKSASYSILNITSELEKENQINQLWEIGEGGTVPKHLQSTPALNFRLGGITQKPLEPVRNTK